MTSTISSEQRHAGIAYDRAGPPGGIPVVLVHAGIADRRMWRPQWEALTAERDCLRLDLRGFGDSAEAPAPGVVDHLADLLSVLDHEGIDHCHLVGASLGAGVCVEAALTRPGLGCSLVLAPPGGSLLATLTDDVRTFVEAERAALAAGDVDEAVETNVDTWAVGKARDAHALDQAYLDVVRTMQRHAFDIQLPWGDVDEAELDPPALERLDEVDVVTLVLLGGHDLDTTADSARRLLSGMPRARLVEWPDVAHLPSMERPADFLTLLDEWLRACAHQSGSRG